MLRKTTTLILFVLLTLSLNAQTVEVENLLPHYKKVSGISGNLNSIGSDTMNNLLALWLEAFKKYYPNVNIQIEGKGSSTAPPALISGTSELGPMSRKMKNEEIDKFEKKFGYKPTRIETSLDALAVYVNKDNPIKGLSMEQLDGIFSKTHKSGHKNVTLWGELGLTGKWSKKKISIYGRNSASGTYGYFKKHALFKGDYKNTVKEQPGSASVVQAVTNDKYSIGYSGVGYKTSGVRIVPLAKKKGEKFYDGFYKNVLSGKYPLSRFLYIYINKKPNESLTPLLKEFLKFVLSYEGQAIVIKDGYLPLPAKVVYKNLKVLK